VLVVDCDLHDGDGTRSIFAEDSTVHTLSLHNRSWDDAPAIEDTRVELGQGIGDEGYQAALREALVPLVERFHPDLVFYLAGADVADGDPLGDALLSPAGILARDSSSPARCGRRVPVGGRRWWWCSLAATARRPGG
jgi:acetoin utilization deacetylase AcuC-like enzyme